MKKIGLLICIFILILGAFFFNAWYMQKIYEVGLIPIMNLFNVELPFISYNAFIVITTFSACVRTAFNYNSKKTEKITYGTAEFNEGITKFFGEIVGMIITKLLSVAILSLMIKCFI